jgi:hypothetical protein
MRGVQIVMVRVIKVPVNVFILLNLFIYLFIKKRESPLLNDSLIILSFNQAGIARCSNWPGF